MESGTAYSSLGWYLSIRNPWRRSCAMHWWRIVKLQPASLRLAIHWGESLDPWPWTRYLRLQHRSFTGLTCPDWDTWLIVSAVIKWQVTVIKNLQNDRFTSERPRTHAIHLRSLSNGRPHPSACNPILLHSQGKIGHGISYIIQVFGTFLGVYFRSDDDDFSRRELGIWNWMTGDLQFVSQWSTMYNLSYL